MDAAARIAARQRGVAARWQLLAEGMTARAIEYRLETDRLRPIHRGVYLVGHPVAPRLSAETAALLACGRGSVLSHQTAAFVWELVEQPAPEVDVTVAARHRRPSGIRVHRTKALPRADIRIRNGLPVTAPERTLPDLAAVIPPRQLAAALDAARARRLLREPHLLSLIAETPTRRGTRALRALLATPGFSRSEAERRLRALIDRAGLPRRERNVRVAGHEVDLVWPEQRLAVEFDSWAHHSDREAFETDRRRDANLVAAGYRVVRVTWRQLVEEPEAVLVRLSRLL